MRALDLFCSAGGAAMGLHQAGFEVVGIDHRPQPRFPFQFIQADALRPPVRLEDFDLVWASPPCQGYSRLRHLPWLKGRNWPRLIEPVREMLRRAKRPYVIENVEDAPLSGFVLCGQMFGLPLYRHRKFEVSWFDFTPSCPGHGTVIGHGRRVNDHRKGTLNAGSTKGAWGNQRIVTVAGGQFKKADGERAMGIDWMTKAELAQAIPPAYARFIGEAAMRHLRARAA